MKHLQWLIVLIVVLLAANLAVSIGRTANVTAQSAKQYWVVSFYRTSINELGYPVEGGVSVSDRLQSVLNNAAKQGWQLYSITEDRADGSYRIIYER